MELKRKLAFDVCVNLGLGEHSFDSVYLNMWRNIREDGGFRLTDHGFQWLSEMGIKSHSITLPTQNNTLLEIKTGNVLLGLDRHLKAPYHIRNNKLNIFDDSISTQILLYGGDIKAYIDANS
jgi:hypothetical protein